MPRTQKQFWVNMPEAGPASFLSDYVGLGQGASAVWRPKRVPLEEEVPLDVAGFGQAFEQASRALFSKRIYHVATHMLSKRVF